VGEKLEANPSITPKQRVEAKRFFYSQSQSVVADKQGRMLVPEALGKRAGLSGEVVLVGTHETFELWSPAAWAAAKKSEEATFAQVADLIGL
jgi:MraZ protein